MKYRPGACLPGKWSTASGLRGQPADSTTRPVVARLSLDSRGPTVDPLYVLPPTWQSLSDAALAGRLDEINTLAGQVDIDQAALDDQPSGVDVLES